MIDSVEGLVETHVDAVLCHLLEEQQLPIPVREFKFSETRRWRFDYCWPEYALAIEVDGCRWANGRHVRGSGFTLDAEKFNEAQVQGWIVLRVFPETLRTDKTISLIKRAFAFRNGA